MEVDRRLEIADQGFDGLEGLTDPDLGVLGVGGQVPSVPSMSR